MELGEDSANSCEILGTLMLYQGTKREVTEQTLAKLVKEPKRILEKTLEDKVKGKSYLPGCEQNSNTFLFNLYEQNYHWRLPKRFIH